MNFDPNCTFHGCEPLYKAAQNGDLSIVIDKYLIDYSKCDPTVKGYEGEMSIHIAALSGKLDVVKYLIENKHCDPNSVDGAGNGVIHVASGFGQLHVLKYLIEELGIDKN